jgi:hypothetical protein
MSKYSSSVPAAGGIDRRTAMAALAAWGGGIVAAAPVSSVFGAAQRSRAYPPSEVLRRRRAMPSLAFPAYLQPLVDPTYATTITRISDRAAFGSSDRVLRHAYAKNQPWNADGSLLILGWTYPAPILDGRTYEFLFMRHQPSQAVWSNTEPNFMFGTHSNMNVFVKADVRQDWRETTLHTFTEFDTIDFGGSEGNLSNDDRFVALMGFKAGSGITLLVYDTVADQVTARLPLGDLSAGASGDADVNNWSMSQSGAYAVVQFNTDRHGRPAGIEVYDRKLNYQRRLTDDGNYGGHFDLGFDAAGDEVAVLQVSSRDLVSARLSDGRRTVQLRAELMNWGIHISCRNLQRPGWCYLSEFAYLGNNRDDLRFMKDKAIYQELLAVRLDGSGTVQHFGHEHHCLPVRNREYDRAAMAAPSRDGRIVIWGSDWENGARNAGVHAYASTANGADTSAAW